MKNAVSPVLYIFNTEYLVSFFFFFFGLVGWFVLKEISELKQNISPQTFDLKLLVTFFEQLKAL